MFLILFPLELTFSLEITKELIFLSFSRAISILLFLDDVLECKNFLTNQKLLMKFQKIILLLADVLSLLTFFFVENSFFKFFFFVKYFDLASLLKFYLKELSYSSSKLIIFILKLILAVHFCTHSWIFFVNKESEQIYSWMKELQLADKPNYVIYIYSLKWVFHIFFPFFSINFHINNELECGFEILSIICAGIFSLWNIDVFLFLVKDYFNSYQTLEKVNYMMKIIKQCEKNELKRDKLTENSLKLMKSEKNIRGDILKNQQIFENVNQESYEELIRYLILPILSEKIPFFFKNFSKEILQKLVKISELKSYNKGDIIIEVNKLKFIFILILFLGGKYQRKKAMPYFKRKC